MGLMNMNSWDLGVWECKETHGLGILALNLNFAVQAHIFLSNKLKKLPCYVAISEDMDDKF